MYDRQTVVSCLLPSITLDGNISKHAPTYLNENILTDAFPKPYVPGMNLSGPLVINIPIPNGVNFEYEYNGDYGENPDVKLYSIAGEIKTSATAYYELHTETGIINLLGDFTVGEWEMALSPPAQVLIAISVQAQIDKVVTGSIDKMLYTVINQKKINTLIKSVIADFKLFDGRADFDNKNANLGRFCFIEFKAKTNNDIVMMLRRVSFQIDTACPDLKLYLYCDDTPNEAVKIIPVPYTANRGVQWQDTSTNADASLNLPPLNDDDTTYYLGYYETDLAAGAQSIKKVADYVNGPCLTGCPGQEVNAQYFKTRTQYVNIRIGYIDAQNLNGLELPDMDAAVYVERNNFGMNIDMNVTCDISNFICTNKQIFIEPLAMQAAIDLLQVIIHSERDNIDLQKAMQGCVYILNGNSDNNYNGLLKHYNKMIDALDIDMSGFSKACLPCSKKPSIIKRYV